MLYNSEISLAVRNSIKPTIREDYSNNGWENMCATMAINVGVVPEGVCLLTILDVKHHNIDSILVLICNGGSSYDVPHRLSYTSILTNNKQLINCRQLVSE